MGSMERYNLSGQVAPTNVVAHSAALYGGEHAPVQTWRDRKNERQHFTEVRQMQRRAVELMAEIQGNALIERAELEASEQALRDAKLAVAAAERESHVIAGDNPVLLTKLTVLDDDFVQQVRLRIMRNLR